MKRFDELYILEKCHSEALVLTRPVVCFSCNSLAPCYSRRVLSSRKNHLLLILTLFGSILLSYLYVINGDFIGDDIDRIAFNPELQTYGEALSGRLRDRPLLMLIVTFVSKVFAIETIYFRILSFFFHSLCAYQIYTFFLELHKDNRSVIKNEVALFCAFGFALHPLHNQAITTAIQVSILMTGWLGLLALKYFYRGISSLKDSNFYKSFLCLFAGALLKPNLFFLPLIFLQQHKKIQGGLKNKIIVIGSYTALMFIPAAFYLLGRVNEQSKNTTPFTYFLAQSEVLFTYFKRIVIPYNFQVLYDFNIPVNPWTSHNWLFVLAHAGIISLAYWKLPSKLLWTLFLFFYLSFLPESSFFPIDHLAFEHRTYFALIFFFIFIGSWIIHYDFHESFKRLAKMATIAICALFIILNQNRNAEIKTFGMWAYHALLHSNSMPYHNYSFGTSLAKAGNIELVEPIIRNLPVAQPGKGYETLVDILDYYKYPERKKEYFQKFIDYVESDKTPPIAKLFLNQIIAEGFAYRNDSLSDLIRIERAFARQLPDIMNNHTRFIVTGIKTNYVGLAILLTEGRHKDAFRQADVIGYLRVKTLLQYYFGRHYDGLEQEIKYELQKQPDKEILKNLIEMLNLKKPN